MKTVKVRCWAVSDIADAEEPMIAYPEYHMGYDLIICLQCGQVHAAAIEAQMYTLPLEEQLETSTCAGCDYPLSGSTAPYPEMYLDNKGIVKRYKRPSVFPDDNDSVVKEFPSIY